ncbi:hypothetical protein ACIPJ2_12875 [Curtobacterium sp. NPDC090217]|uniref:hypothetical protein n=1 Tax=Curtobacterium sp. NPDC090217 TaxID=3363970 RepID=UPI003828C478
MHLDPVVTPPHRSVFDHMLTVPTPALVYDVDNAMRSVGRMLDDVSLVSGARLNVALKSCHTPAVLRHLADAGLGADCASVRELDLAVSVGFDELSATGPSFSDEGALDRLAERGVVLDATSIDQLELIGRTRSGSDVGLRLRLPIPETLDTANSFGANSRFGVGATDPAVHAVLVRHRLRVTRLHLHTGQLSPHLFLWELRYTLTVAESMSHVELIDFGGGFYDFYADRAVARRALQTADELLAQWRARTGRPMAIRFEPGAAVLGPHGYLVTTVQSIEQAHPAYGAEVVQVDTSAWNYAPWHLPAAVPLDEPERQPKSARLVSGNTLYENDFFGMTGRAGRPLIDMAAVSVGERLVLTNAGAYTMTNRRDFNLLGNLREYLIVDDALRPVDTEMAATR